MLTALGYSPKNELTFRSRQKSTETIKEIGKPDFNKITRVDAGIASGYECAKNALELVPEANRSEFSEYLQSRVHIIFYQVPKDIDLNHYFEVMNSRGEQLEQHEVVKATLLGKLDNDADRAKFNGIWERCSEMDGYIQQKFSRDFAEKVFGRSRKTFLPDSFDCLPNPESADGFGRKTINELMDSGQVEASEDSKPKAGAKFQPIIDFPNFLLIVLKLTRMGEQGFDPTSFILDDKELIKQFDYALSKRLGTGKAEAVFVKEFGYNLLLSKFYLDNYVVHHVLDDDKPGDNPWKLQCWELHANERGDQGYPTNLFSDVPSQNKCEQLLSMFEVSFTARQRKNYLLYCMRYLHDHKDNPCAGYPEFLSNLAKAFLYDVYWGPSDGLNEKNIPRPGSFDAALLVPCGPPSDSACVMKDFTPLAYGVGEAQRERAQERFGDGNEATRGIPLFVFNYLDYLLWEAYYDHIRGRKKDDAVRQAFFEDLECSDFGLDVFDDFYFSRTRRSLEHYYSQAQQKLDESSGRDAITLAQINCLGNYAMIGSDINSSGSNWSPKVKLDHYLDQASGKINHVSVASLKFMVMMQICKDNVDVREPGKEWTYQDIEKHQKAMTDVLLGQFGFSS